MKTIIFRPLRRVKKTGKIVVASYPQWYRISTTDYSNPKFNLIVNDEYKLLPSDGLVYTHEGQSLYFFDYNPAEVKTFHRTVIDDTDFDYDGARKKYKDFIIHSDGGKYGSPHTSFFMRGTDCSGVPTFTHWTEDRVTMDDCWNYYGGDTFVPLTVEIVTKWFGWFLFQLNNSYLQIGK